MNLRRFANLAPLAAAFAAALWLGAASMARADDGPFTPEPDLRPREVRGLKIHNTLGDRIPLDLEFTNVDGSIVPLGRFFNRSSSIDGVKKPVVLIMVYFRCPILCPMVLEKFTDTLNKVDFTVGSEYDAVVVSFDARDKPQDAVTHRANQLLYYRQPTTDSIRDGWTFLTCRDKPQEAQKLADALGFDFRWVEPADEFAHGSAVYILTPEGKISRILTGLNYPADDVRLALLEASEGKIGSLFDKFTLWCYHFDPTRGTYTMQAFRVMQVGAVGCAVALGVFIGSMLLWERRKRRAAAATAIHADPTVSPAPPDSRSADRNGRNNRTHPRLNVGISGHAR